MFLGVPWAVEGGAANPVDGARIVSYAATSGADGVLGLADLRVTQLSTAGPGVAIGVGAAIIPCRAAGIPYQSYVASRPVADDTLAVPANGGGSTFYGLAVARVENPWLSSEPYPTPPSTANGPYVYPRLLSGSGITQSVVTNKAAARAYLKAQGMSAVPLAGISLPPSTSAVLTSHITDLRNIANPRTAEKTLTYNPTVNANVPASWANWIAPATWKLDVPDWATTLAVFATVQGRADKQGSSTTGKVYGQLRIALGSDASAVFTQASTYDFDAPGNSAATRVVLLVADTVTVPPAYRGTTQTVAIQGDELGGNQPLFVDTASTAVLQTQFGETTT